MQSTRGAAARVMRGAALALAITVSRGLRAEDLGIVNADFETPQLTGTTEAHYTYGPGWGSSAKLYKRAGHQYVGETNAPGWGGNGSGITFYWNTLPPTNGNNACWIDSAGWAEQQLSDVFEPDCTYELSADVGYATDISPAPVPWLRLYYKISGTLYEVAPVSSNSPSLVQGSWVRWSRTYQLTPGHPALGKNIWVLMGRLSGGTQVQFDNLRLTRQRPAPQGSIILVN